MLFSARSLQILSAGSSLSMRHFTDKQRESIQEAVASIKSRWMHAPRIGIVLGSGLGSFVRRMSVEAEIPYRELPGFPHSTAIGHQGQFACGVLDQVPLIAMQGRFHLYEGYSWDDVALPVHVLHQLGIQALVLSNAAGGINPNFRRGEIMVISDHIDLLKKRPWSGSREATPYRHGHGSPYDKKLSEFALRVARKYDFVAHQGTYVALTGPNYETKSEYRFLRRIGGDAVGMSTVPEAVTAAERSIPVLAMSVITNEARPDAMVETSGEDVIHAAASAEQNLSRIVVEVVRSIGTR